MAQLVKTFPKFNMVSQWEGYYDPPPYVYYTPADTHTVYKDFDISDMPAGAILTGATLSAVLGSPYTGSAVRTVDGTTFHIPRDVLAKIQALNGNYSNAVRFTFKFKANGGQGGFGDHTSTLSVDNLTLTIDYTMPASTGSLNLAEVDIGQTIRLQNIVSQDATYTHKARWKLNGQGEQVQNLGANPGYTDFTLPASWYDILPAAVSGPASVTLETYSAAGALLGSNTYTFTAKVPASIIPTITNLAAAKHSDTTPAVPGAWNKWIKTKSKAIISADVAAGTGSSIKSVKAECAALGFVGYALPYTSGLLTAAGTFSFTVTVTDQRNRTKALSVNVTVDDYTPPAASNVAFSRAATDGGAPDPNGTYIRGIATITGATLGGLNAITAKAYYRRSGTSTWLPAGGQAVTSGAAFWMGAGAIDPAYTYEVKIDVADTFGTVPVAGPLVQTTSKLWDFRTDRASLGRYPTDPGFSTPTNWPWYYKGQDLDARFAPISHTHSAASITTGTLAVERGGTGQTSLAALRNAAGLGNTTGALPVANGGTGGTSKATARTGLGFTASTGNGAGADGDVHFKYT